MERSIETKDPLFELQGSQPPIVRCASAGFPGEQLSPQFSSYTILYYTESTCPKNSKTSYSQNDFFAALSHAFCIRPQANCDDNGFHSTRSCTSNGFCTQLAVSANAWCTLPTAILHCRILYIILHKGIGFWTTLIYVAMLAMPMLRSLRTLWTTPWVSSLNCDHLHLRFFVQQHCLRASPRVSNCEAATWSWQSKRPFLGDKGAADWFVDCGWNQFIFLNLDVLDVLACLVIICYYV